MIMLNTVEARALLDILDGKVPDHAALQVQAALHRKLKNHEWLIEQCEASVSRPAKTEEPA
jgi:hypothetical protein